MADPAPQGVPLAILLAWAERHCVVPDGWNAGRPWHFVEWQLRVYAAHYTVRADAQVPPGQPALEASAFVYRRTQIVLPQKAGKGPLTAVFVCGEAEGPVLFAGWARGGESYSCREQGCPCGWTYEYLPGEPMGLPWPTPLIQITGPSQDNTDNVYRHLRPMIDRGPLSAVIPRTTDEHIKLPGRGEIVPVTSSANTRLGNPLTFSVQDETGVWTQQNRMIGVAETQRRGLGGMKGRAVEPLALDTPVPTPSGWSTVGDLTTGDSVYDSAGLPVEIEFTTPIYHDRACYRVTFDDGEQLVASGSHGWTLRRAHRKRGGAAEVTATTAEIAGQLDRFHWSMPLVPVSGVQAELLVDPYYLGLWLGDGFSDDAAVCCSHEVVDELAVLVKDALGAHEQLEVSHRHSDAARLRPRRRHRYCRWGHDWSDDEMCNGTRDGRQSVTCGACQRREPRLAAPLLTMRERLRSVGVLGNKHIPAGYLGASRDQRLALLQGLMDSDGTIAVDGRATFVNTNEQLAHQAAELVVSLGHKVGVHRYDYPERGLPAIHVSFVPTKAEPVTKLAAKTARHRTTRGAWASRRFIRSVEPVASVPTRCIGISTDDRLFVVGRRNTLTHNTTNAWDPAEQSVAQRTAESHATDIYRFMPEAPKRLSYRNKSERARIHRHVYAGSHWIDLDAIEAEAAELLEVDPEQAERFYGNRLVIGQGAWMPEGLWQSSKRADIVVLEGAAVCLGFDGSDSDDWTAIRAETLEGHRFTPRYGPDQRPTVWKPAQWNGRIPRDEVHVAVEELHRRYRVERMYADPPGWDTEIDDWALRHGEGVIPWATYRTVQMHEALRRSLTDLSSGASTHDADPDAELCVGNARRQAARGDRYMLAKPDSARKIDVAMADVLAHEAAADARAAGWARVKASASGVSHTVYGFS